jgi:hypothetical protein
MELFKLLIVSQFPPFPGIFQPKEILEEKAKDDRKSR